MTQTTEEKAVAAMDSEIIKNYISNAFRIVMSVVAFAALWIFNDLNENVKELKTEIHAVSNAVQTLREKLVQLDSESKKTIEDIKEIKEFNIRTHNVTEKK